MEHVISITPGGNVSAMYSDVFSLAFLGRQRIQRASEVLWDEEAQSWSIWFDKAKPLTLFSGFASYEVARAFEVKAMNYHFRTGLPISSFPGDDS